MLAPTSLQAPQHQLDLPEALGALIVHLLWTDAREWDARRRLRREDALAFADALARILPDETRESLERLRDREAA